VGGDIGILEEQSMPTSKKPRKKTATKALPKPHVAPSLRDRRAMESFLAAIAGQTGDDATARAQDVMYDAWEESNPRKRIALARKALDISPLCADAYVLLAEASKGSIEQARDYYTQGVQAGELALGPEGFKEYAGHFWGFLETRPYMRARAGLAHALLKLGDVDGAIGHFRELLRLNPNDNQGLRYSLAGCLLRRDDAAAVSELLADYADEGSAFWLYTRALMAFRAGGPDDPEAISLAKAAWSANEHVPAVLIDDEPAVVPDNDYITMGGADEAADYVIECGIGWHRTPGAIPWLTSIVSALPKKRPGRRAVR
jgi:tetratricopeptide (TPR) repeat protein